MGTHSYTKPLYVHSSSQREGFRLEMRERGESYGAVQPRAATTTAAAAAAAALGCSSSRWTGGRMDA